MQLVVPSAVTKAVRAATITFTTTSTIRFFFILFPPLHFFDQGQSDFVDYSFFISISLT